MSTPGREALQTALPAYEIGTELGRGAFGVVWAARHTQLGRDVAIKQLPQAFAANATVRGRFVDEARTVASLEHPHIVPVYDFVENSDACLLVMERCADSVGDRFKTSGIATDESCAAVLACLAALDHAHARGVLHRDVKPENLMYDMAGTVKLADFGIARALHHDVRRTATGMVVGTPAYMSPEQVRGDTLGPASDVYSVAMMAYELLTGELPFPDSESANGLLAHHLVTEPVPLLSTRPELPGSIGTVIDRALSKGLSARHASALELANDLSQACVTAFGSGWLRRRRFILHWPDIVAENERTGPTSPRTGTIVVQAQLPPHDVITPSAALAGSAAPLDYPPPGSPPQAPAAVSTTPPPPGFPPGQEAPSASKQPLAIVAGVVIAMVLGLALVFVATNRGSDEAADPGSAAQADGENDRDDTTNGDQSEPTGEQASDETSDSPLETTADAGSTAADATDTGSDQPSTADQPLDRPDNASTNPTGDREADDPSTETDPAVGVGVRPPDYDPFDASEALRPTPCPVEAERHACIYIGAALSEQADIVNFNFFTGGFVPDIDRGGFRVHFYFDTAVDGDENAAGTGVSGGSYVEWDLPVFVDGDDIPAGREMLTPAEAKAVDARHLCVIVADPAGVAIPGSGNCTPVFQDWDFETFQQQVDRPSGKWIGGCPAGVSAIVPLDWRTVDLSRTSPSEAALEMFPSAVDVATALFQSDGATLFAIGPAASVDINEVTVLISVFEGDVTLASTPVETDALFTSLGIDVGDAAPQLINDRQISVTVVDDGTTVTARYRIPDFEKAFEVAVSAPSGSDIAGFARQFAATVVGC